MHLIYNGKQLTEADFSLKLDNRAFTYGDGVFETIIASSGRVHFLTNHLERLSLGIKALDMNLPNELTTDAVEKQIINLLKATKIEKQARIKIMVWRRSGGLFTPSVKDAEYIITAVPHTPAAVIHATVRFYKDIRLTYSPISRFKTLSALPYVMAGIAKSTMQADDVILFDTEDHIAECLASNIYWIKNEKLYTPSTSTGCKEGVMRKQIINFLNKNNIKWEEGKYKKEDLLNADFVFSSNVAGLIPIMKIEDKEYKTQSELFNKIQKHLSPV